MTDVELIHAPSDVYLERAREALAGATRVTLISAFATASGFDLLVGALRQVLTQPDGQAHIVVALERRLFNADPLFRELLSLREEFRPRVSLSVVPENLGILHAKALLCERKGASTTLIVGSANLTASAFCRNHELGVVLRDPGPEVVTAFRAFARSLDARTLDDNTASEFLTRHGMIRADRRGVGSTAVTQQAPSATWQSLLDAVGKRCEIEPDADEPGQTLSDWVSGGYLVGPGRSGTDALVLRLPMAQLEQRGLVSLSRKRSLGGAARESRTLGYQVELLPPERAEQVRVVSRRITRLRSRLSLDFPCFGHWMPASYWDVFEEARARLQADPALERSALEQSAKAQHERLLAGGQLEADLALILESMTADGVIGAERRAAVESYLAPELRRRLETRTPDVLVAALQFRTSRQRWTPYEQTDVPYRQLMVDVIQAVFSPTLRTGDWPRRFHSLAARDLAEHIGARLEEAGHERDGRAGIMLLEHAQTWERDDVQLARAVDEFRLFVPLDHDFEPPQVDDLIDETFHEEE
jgi:HKD family nuclease